MNASDQLAYQIGRAILDLHIARQTIAAKDAEIEALKQQLADRESTKEGEPTWP